MALIGRLKANKMLFSIEFLHRCILSVYQSNNYLTVLGGLFGQDDDCIFIEDPLIYHRIAVYLQGESPSTTNHIFWNEGSLRHEDGLYRLACGYTAKHGHLRWPLLGGGFELD